MNATTSIFVGSKSGKYPLVDCPEAKLVGIVHVCVFGTNVPAVVTAYSIPNAPSIKCLNMC